MMLKDSECSANLFVALTFNVSLGSRHLFFSVLFNPVGFLGKDVSPRAWTNTTGKPQISQILSYKNMFLKIDFAGKNKGLGPLNPAPQAAFVLMSGLQITEKCSPYWRMFGDFCLWAEQQSEVQRWVESWRQNRDITKGELYKALKAWAEFAQRFTKCWSWSWKHKLQFQFTTDGLGELRACSPLRFSFHIYRLRMINSKVLCASRAAVESCTDVRKNWSSGDRALAKHVQTACGVPWAATEDSSEQKHVFSYGKDSFYWGRSI